MRIIQKKTCILFIDCTEQNKEVVLISVAISLFKRIYISTEVRKSSVFHVIYILFLTFVFFFLFTIYSPNTFIKLLYQSNT